MPLTQTSTTIAKKAAKYLFGGVVLSYGAATYYRPLPQPSNHKHESHKSNETRDRSSAVFCSKTSPYFTRADTPILLSIAQHMSIGVTTLAIRLFMNSYGRYHIVNDEHYQNFLSLVLRREKDESLITVSNHRSLFDDPGVVSCLLPLWVGVQPKYNRWGICSQEYCFADNLPMIIKGYIGAGQVLPIHRGGGINQSLFRDFASFVSRGEWCHIFPEGGVWQLDELGGKNERLSQEQRSSKAFGGKQPASNGVVFEKRGKLKWGVGKLIAHAPRRPRVIVFAHAGMENLLPQNTETMKTYLNINLFGGSERLNVHVRIGEELFFDDLIKQHEVQHGKLWSYSHKEEQGQWHSSNAEKELYNKIALRIEESLEKLTTDVVRASRHSVS